MFGSRNFLLLMFIVIAQSSIVKAQSAQPSVTPVQNAANSANSTIETPDTSLDDKAIEQKVLSQGVPAPAVKRLFEFLKMNSGKTVAVAHKNRMSKGAPMVNRSLTIREDFAVIVDFSLPSDERRLFYINLKTGQVDKHLVAHGKGSGVRIPSKFSNIDGSKMSSLGLYLTGSTYYGQHGESLNLHGLEASNSKAAHRDIVVHAANYVSLDYAKSYSRVGRSWGCPAVAPGIIKKMLSLKNGTVVYAWHKELMTETLKNPVLQEVQVQDDGADVDLPEEEETLRKQMAESLLKPQ